MNTPCHINESIHNRGASEDNIFGLLTRIAKRCDGLPVLFQNIFHEGELRRFQLAKRVLNF